MSTSNSQGLATSSRRLQNYYSSIFSLTQGIIQAIAEECDFTTTVALKYTCVLFYNTIPSEHLKRPTTKP